MKSQRTSVSLNQAAPENVLIRQGDYRGDGATALVALAIGGPPDASALDTPLVIFASRAQLTNLRNVLSEFLRTTDEPAHEKPTGLEQRYTI